MRLQIAIPAYNEEESIDSIIQRCLAAREHIISHSPVRDVEIAVVSDGSTDRTVEIAGRYQDQIRLIVFEQNRGYGAAIKEGWKHSDAELIGFLDADGTCDPLFFANLCQTLVREKADVVLGSRLNRNSRMPLIRRIGNTFFAVLLSLFSSIRVRDTASGMRVLRRTALPALFPLPNGLHFTPAMTARALMSGSIGLVEIEMPYHEREGESKLRVGKDGLRFLKSILDMIFLYQPWRPLLIIAAVCLVIAVGLMAMPTVYYLQHRSVQEWMIYRFIVSHLTGITAILMLSAAYLTGQMARIALSYPSKRDPLARFMSRPLFILLPLGFIAAGTALVIPSFLELVRTGATYEHWSRFIAMSFCYLIAMIFIVTWAGHYVLHLLAGQLDYLRTPAAEPSDSAFKPPARPGSASSIRPFPVDPVTDKGTRSDDSSSTSQPQVAG